MGSFDGRKNTHAGVAGAFGLNLASLRRRPRKAKDPNDPAVERARAKRERRAERNLDWRASGGIRG